ncbi:MAG: Gfo/Idh/MocA family oxidoreductase [Deltaproteobacteria bacterium]|nr:Gfo/Idh/MocA family oxidoreductase [Deltaproteobacteria bacterium]
MSYRASIIGCGRVAWMLEDDPLEQKPCTHMGAYQSLRDMVEVTSASDTDNARLDAFGKRYGVSALYNDYKKMLLKEEPEIVSVCAYATERFTMVMDSIDAGVKGIWCEKALAANLDEARLMSEAAEAKGVKVIVSHLRRWSGEYAKVKEIIERKRIGNLQSIVCHFGGSLLHTGTHAFDVLLWLCGPALWVEGELEAARGHKLWDNIEDLGGRAVVKFKNNVYATVHAESKAYFFFEFDIIGDSGRVRIGNNGVLEYYIPKDSAYYTGIKELHPKPFPEYELKNIWVEALGNLIGAVEGREESKNTLRDGLNALELALAIHESSRNNGMRVNLPLKDCNITVRSR